jgi:hypothetical protein
VNSVSEPLTMDMIHHHLSHIVPAAAWKLVNDGMVSGLKLGRDPGSNYFCESCVFAKLMCKAIVKEC